MTDPVVVTWTPSKDETIASVRAWWKCAPPRLRVRERWIGRFALVVGAVLFIPGLTSTNAAMAAVGGGLLGVGSLLAFDRTGARLAARRLTRLPNRDGPIRFVADLSGVGWERAAEEHRYPWTSVTGVYDTGAFALLTFGAAGMITIPRDVLGDDGVDRLAKLWAAVNVIETLPPTPGS